MSLNTKYNHFHSSFFFPGEQPWGTPKLSFSAMYYVLAIGNVLCTQHVTHMIWYQKFSLKSLKQMFSKNLHVNTTW